MSTYLSPKVKLKKSKIGKGLFAFQKIKKGELIIDFSKGKGQFLETKKVDQLFDKGVDYGIQVDTDLFFVATNKDELEPADFLNHSCDPNCGIKNKLKIIAMKDIFPGNEITFDYAMSESSEYEMICKCSALNCRGKITGDDWKLKDLQKRYKGFFSDYLAKKILRLNL